MDIYEPGKGTTKFVTGREKPTVIFMFGGGFIRGSRADGDMLPVFGRMRSEGIRVVSIDYRLGLKGQKGGVGIGNVDELDNAIHMAVEDLYSATEFILSNAGELGINESLYYTAKRTCPIAGVKSGHGYELFHGWSDVKIVACLENPLL